jgi:hypothetical protein
LALHSKLQTPLVLQLAWELVAVELPLLQFSWQLQPRCILQWLLQRADDPLD